MKNKKREVVLTKPPIIKKRVKTSVAASLEEEKVEDIATIKKTKESTRPTRSLSELGSHTIKTTRRINNKDKKDMEGKDKNRLLGLTEL